MQIRGAPPHTAFPRSLVGFGAGVALALIFGCLTADRAAASLRIVNPKAASSVSGPIKLRLLGAPRATRVALFVNGKLRRVDRRRPWRFGPRGSKRVRLRSGRQRLTVSARFRDGHVRKASVVVFNRGPRASARGPSVRWLSPSNGTQVSGQLAGERCQVAASDSRGIERVEFFVDGRAVGTERSSPWNCSIDADALSPGRHTFRAVARNRTGRTSSASVDVSASSPPTAQLPGPIGGRITHLGDFETGDLSQWDTVQTVSRDRIQVVQSPARQGRYAARFEVRPGDNIGDTSPRAEVAHNMREPENSERFYRWYTYFDPSFPSNYPNSFITFTQWRALDESGSYTSFMVWGDRMELRRDGTRWSAPLVKGAWHKFVYRVKWSPDPSVGFMELYHNDRLVMPKTHLRTMAGTPGRAVGNYMKQGLYKSDEIPTGVLYHDGLTVGDSYAAVNTAG